MPPSKPPRAAVEIAETQERLDRLAARLRKYVDRLERLRLQAVRVEIFLENLEKRMEPR